MSLLVLNIEGQPFVQAVRLDDPSPGYAAFYVAALRRHLDPMAVLRWVEVDVSSVAEYGPDDIAAMLSEDTQEESGLLTDLPQRWQTAGPVMPMPSSATERRHELASERGEGEWE